jgi:hypothetical protein
MDDTLTKRRFQKSQLQLLRLKSQKERLDFQQSVLREQQRVLEEQKLEIDRIKKTYGLRSVRDN